MILTLKNDLKIMGRKFINKSTDAKIKIGKLSG